MASIQPLHKPSPSVQAVTCRLGAIGFLNTLPIYHDFTTPSGVQLSYDSPAGLNQRVLAGDLDISPVSSACYLRNQEHLLLLEDLSVSSPGSVNSVVLLSKTPLDSPEFRMRHPLVAVPDNSETSVALLVYLLKAQTGEDCEERFLTYPAAAYPRFLEETGCVLVIGDDALLLTAGEGAVPEGFHCYDLSNLWVQRTGLPFVFAVWVARRDWVAQAPEANHALLRQLNQDLIDSRERFFHTPTLMESAIEIACRRFRLSPEALRRYYVESLFYGLTPRHRQALNYFQALL